MKAVSCFIFSVLFSCLLLSVRANGQKPPAIKAGILDLTQWDLETNGPVLLDGSWEFYWNKLYSPADFSAHRNNACDAFITVPGVWNDVKVNGEKIPGYGFATYHAVVKLSHHESTLGLKLLDASSAFKLFVNGKIVAVCGKVSSSREGFSPAFLPQTVVFPADSDQLDIVIQVSNYFHDKAGLWESLRLGTPHQVIHARETAMIIELFIAGAIFILFIYHFWIFLLRRREYAALYFGLCCLLVTIYTIIKGERIFYFLFPGFPLNIGLRIEYCSVFLFVPFFSAYVYEIFPADFPRRLRHLIWWTGLAEALIICLSPAFFFTKLAAIFKLLLLLTAACLVGVIFKSMRKKRPFAVIFFWSGCLLLAAAVNDILYSQLIINSVNLSAYVFFIFLVLQANILARRFSNWYTTIEDLSEELNLANINLEKKVEDRTRELRDTQQQLIQQEKLAALGQMTAGIAHEIQNPLNFVTNFSGVSSEIIEELKGAATENERKKILDELMMNNERIYHHSLRISAIVKNMQDHAPVSSGKKTDTDINLLCKEFIDMTFQRMLSLDPAFTCAIRTDLAPGLPEIYAEPEEIARLLLNLFNNAFYAIREKSRKEGNTFSPELFVSTRTENNNIHIIIRDNGTGIPGNIRHKIFEPFFTTKPTGEGTGLGLSISNDIIKAYNGELRITSAEGEYAELQIILPVLQANRLIAD